ncbi:MAG: glycosyltransferase, partial [Alcaligenaceae bacterium]
MKSENMRSLDFSAALQDITLPDAPSAWTGHVPFGAWLVQQAQPRILVELGVHYGHSYFTFCQSIKMAGLLTKCYAIDTWQGDDHSGLYGEGVFAGVQSRNTSDFESFSRLLKMTFDEGAECFSERSIDLLHIDGLHTYEAVRHDYETWFPRLSECGIVMFHDINVRERGFGVWRLWEELSNQYPSVEFMHSHGLGVLFVGPRQPLQIEELLKQWSDVSARKNLTQLFRTLGYAVERESELKVLQTSLMERGESLSLVQHQLDALQASAARKEEQCLADIAKLHRQIQEATRENIKLERTKVTHERRAEELHSDAEELRRTAAASDQRADALLHSLEAVRASRSWRITAPLRWAGSRVANVKAVVRLIGPAKKRSGGWTPLVLRTLGTVRREGIGGLKSQIVSFGQGGGSADRLDRVRIEPDETLAREVFQAQQSEFTLKELKDRIDAFDHRPLISIVMPVYRTPPKWLARAIESLQEQAYENWELCAVDDCSPADDQRRLLKEYASRDDRIRYQFMVENKGISAASNVALEMATGEYIALVDHDDEITPDAFYWVVKAINEHRSADFIYTDECKIDDTPARTLFNFIFKPKWAPEILFNGMLTGHLTIYKTETVKRVGGFRPEYDFSQDYDLALRVSEVAKSIVHIERVLYLWRAIEGSAAGGGKTFARESNVAALSDYLKRNEIDAVAHALPYANYVEVSVPKDIKVSIIVPSDSYENLRLAIQSLIAKTSFLNYEIVAVCNSPLATRLSAELAADRVVFSPYDKPYNFSDKCNQGANEASGDIVVFYNDDVFPIEINWLEKLVEYLFIPGVEGVSPKLLYEDETIQYAGMISGTPGLCGTAYNGVPRDANDPFLSMHKYV